MDTIATKKTFKEIMVIDDDPINNLIASKYLQKAGLSSNIFDNPMFALAYLRDEKTVKPDLILLDINMPQMTGFEFLKEMENENLFFDVIILTSSINLEDKNHSQKFKSVIDFWVKPLSFSKVTELNALTPYNH